MPQRTFNYIEMNKENEQLETLNEIRSLMERSSRFISLSGLSGVFAGIFALAGAALAYKHLHLGITSPWDCNEVQTMTAGEFKSFFFFFMADAICVLIASLAAGIFFTVRKAKIRRLQIWDATAKRLLINMFIPLVAGGLFCLSLMINHIVGPVPSAVLIFYGLACVNASKYTLHDVRYLGLTEIGLGLIGLVFWEYSLLLWAIGFGLVHIIYGIVMYYKYERLD